eukprot:CAMPEP_0196997298 /NCGR_PEP_ID=MMETSP1380-20130617/2948_1 /TAXON_ID=5936 /ORGANISM="Euplotes crassus, Strain CT5" /LENGTH=687 /DNA_ID=CAMNT_0042413491 /DNA_START=1212 /DNA_END=3272 /DNA_ORIENTATION=+
MIKRKVKSKEIMMREIDEVKEELGLNKSNSKDLSISKHLHGASDDQLDKNSKSQELDFDQESKEERKSDGDSEESKIVNKHQEDEMMKNLKQETMLEKMNKRPQREQKRESKSEAAKIARYNIKLLESIYQAYEPDKADNVVKVFRKGGVFSVEPIMEEDFEESFDTANHDLESLGALGSNAALAGGALAAGALGATTLMSNKDDKGTLDDIKEENSRLFEDTDYKGVGHQKGVDHQKGIDHDNLNDLMEFSKENESEQTGYDLEKQNKDDKFESIDEGSDFNALADGAIAAAAVTQLMEEGKDGDKHKNRYDESSSEFEEETYLDFEGKKRKRRRRRRRKKNPNYNAKLKQLEDIYDNSKNKRNRGDLTTKSRMDVSRTTFNKHIPVGLNRDITRKMSDFFSPLGNESTKVAMVRMESKTSTNWNKKNGIKKKTTMTKKSTRKLSESPTGLKTGEPLFKAKMTNAEAHRRNNLKKDNFLRASINHAGQEQVHSKGSASSRGFADIRKKLKRGNSTHRKSMNHHDFAVETKKMQDELRQTKRKFPKRKVSKGNAMIRLDGESPYMEYLPARYREYKPKEKKYVRQKSNVSMGSIVRRLGEAYSENRSFAGESRSGSRKSGRPSRKGSHNKSLLRMGTFRSQKSVSSNANSVKSGRSRLGKRKPKKSQSSNDDSFLQMANLVKQRVLK